MTILGCNAVGMRKAIVSLTLLTAAVAGLALLYSLRSGEPVYQGKPLTGWLEQYSTNHWSAGHGGDLDRQAEAALQHIGTNAVPIYLQMMTAKESPLKVKLLTRLPKTWLARFHVPRVDEYQAHIVLGKNLGASGIAVLGAQAKPFIPDLIALTSNEDMITRRLALFALSSLGPAAKAALPEMIKCLKDPDLAIRGEAATGLGEIHQEPERSVRILIDFIEKNHIDFIEKYHTEEINWFPSSLAIKSLGKFGAQAKPAVPMLIGLLKDSQQYIREAATNALRDIDPDAAAKAGVQ
jgi:hypothetical protein